MTAVVETALRCAERGWYVFPCRVGSKQPATARGLLDATRDPRQIERWWTGTPGTNLAVRTGEPSSLVVLDVDGEEGADSLHELEQKHGRLPMTASVVTPRGGQHFYFQHPGVEVRNTAGTVGDGLDVRGDGGYVLVPPSIVNGRCYEVDEQSALAPMPVWLTPDSTSSEHAQPSDVWTSMVRDGAGEGSRNVSMARLVGHLLRRYVDVDLVAEVAHLVNGQRWRPPLEPAEVDRIIDSLARVELRRRQSR